MYGLDISRWQQGIDLSASKYDFCIIKATEGIGYTDPSFKDYAVQLTKLGKLIGCYHFARPDLNGTEQGMKDEAKWFVDVIRGRGLLHKAILILDWEKKPFDNSKLISTWLDTLYLMTGSIPFIYGSRSKINKWDSYSFINKYPLWIASYPNAYKGHSIGEEVTETIQESKYSWKIWQYSSTGTYPGYGGNVDLDYTRLTKEDWLSYAGENYDEGTEMLSSDMRWMVSMGFYSGYDDGKFGPKDPLTREQAAIVLHKMWNKIKNEE